MFRRNVQTLDEVLMKMLRAQGLETPLLQKRLIDAWDTVAGPTVARYTTQKYIKNQTLYVRIANPALRQDLSMMRSQLLQRLNSHVGSMVIADIRIG
ncbi:MAG: DUF721 domain-containing protein [Prevotella sp.]|nr:DUF721 domain-containing protein [Bacteroidales bacterium]MDY3841547.1 DUF721 domain-containing protein [Prevotella sp.]